MAGLLLRILRAMMRFVDIPPLWLALAIAAAWAQATHLPIGPALSPVVTGIIGPCLVVIGCGLAACAVCAFLRARTTILPHHTPSALITRGIFAHSRNPIYLADVFILTGAILWLNALASLVLVPIFVAWIQSHFIGPEEARMRAAFGTEFDTYTRTTRRWL